MKPNSSITLLMDGNFAKVGDQILSPHMGYRKFAARFSNDFSHIRIAARCFPAQTAQGEAVTGAGTEFIDLGGYRGVRSLARHLPGIIWRVSRVVRNAESLLLRFPGNLSLLAMVLCRLAGKRFSAEIVADPADYFSEAASRHPLRRIARAVHCRATRSAAMHGCTVRYVTTKTLQASYPARSPSRSFGFSDVYLPDDIFESRDDTHLSESAGDAFRIVNVAMMHNESKGHVLLLRAVAALRASEMNIALTLVGDGALRTRLEALSAELGISDAVQFKGTLNGNHVLCEVRQHSLFVLPSLQEGMPRALLEAMAVGVPAIASRVGGIAEVLEAVSLFPPANVEALSERIAHFATDAESRAEQKRRQKEIARRFRYSELQVHYRNYFEALKTHG